MKGLDGVEDLCIVLIGDYPELAEKEVIYSLEESGFYFEFIERKGLLLLIKSHEDVATYLSWRCSKVRHVLKLFFKGKIEELKELRFPDFKGSYAVKIHSFDLENKKQVPILERVIGSMIYSKERKVDLEKPEHKILGYIKDSILYLGFLISSSNRKQYLIRRPSKKPAFHPSSMMPENARLMVNLAKAPLSGVFLDPFCGVGGILIEASFIADHCIGIDIDRKMIRGCKKNIEYYGIYNADLIHADATKLPLRYVNSIACDTPYGIAASLKKREHEELIMDFLNEIRRFKKLRICFATTLEEMDLNGFKRILKYPQKVRDSLIRWLHVLELND